MMEDGKIAIPHAVESERMVLGSILIDSSSMKKVAHVISHKDFYNKGNALIYRSMEKLYHDQQDIDAVSVMDELKLRGYLEDAGGAEYLIGLTSDVTTVLHIVTHARTVQKRATLRRMIRAGADIVRMSQEEGDLDQLLMKAEEKLKGVTRAAAHAENKLALINLEDWREIARNTTAQAGQVRGLSFGFKNLDDVTEGIEPGEMVILTGHTKHGKSKLATNIAYNVAQSGKTVLFINTEMTKLQVARRFNAIDEGPMKGKIILNDRGTLQYMDAIHLMERAKEVGCDLVIIDHLHFFSRSLDNEANQLSIITKEFKEAAVEYELPLIMLCHVSQSNTKQVPTLQSIKGSSSIAQDADIVLTVWRDDRPNAPNPDDTKVVRLAHRSASNANRTAILYSDGMRLSETPFAKDGPTQYEMDAQRLGEKDDDLEDVKFDNKDMPW
jgi:replicative DNA helicase